MDKIEPSQQFLFEGNVSQTCKLQLKNFCFCFTATQKDNKEDKIKNSVLSTSIGQKGREIYKALNFDSANDEIELGSIQNKYSEYCNINYPP